MNIFRNTRKLKVIIFGIFFLLFFFLGEKVFADEASLIGRVYMVIDGETINLPGVVLYKEDNPGPGIELPHLCSPSSYPNEYWGVYAVSNTSQSSTNYFFRDGSPNTSQGVGASLNGRNLNVCPGVPGHEEPRCLGIRSGGNPYLSGDTGDTSCDNRCFDAFWHCGLSCGDGSPQYTLPYFPKTTYIGSSESGGSQISFAQYMAQNYPYIEFNPNDPKGGGTWAASCSSAGGGLTCSNGPSTWNFASNYFPTTAYAPGEWIRTSAPTNAGTVVANFRWIPQMVPPPPINCGDPCTTEGEACDDGTTCINSSGGLLCLGSDYADCDLQVHINNGCACPPPGQPAFNAEKEASIVCINDNTAARITYTITVRNVATVSGTITSVTDTYDSRFQASWVSNITPTPDSHTGNVITWNNNGAGWELAGGGSLTFTYDVTVPSEYFGTYDGDTFIPYQYRNFAIVETQTGQLPPLETVVEIMCLVPTGIFDQAVNAVVFALCLIILGLVGLRYQEQFGFIVDKGVLLGEKVPIFSGLSQVPRRVAQILRNSKLSKKQKFEIEAVDKVEKKKEE